MVNSKSIKSNTGYKGIYFDKARGAFEVQVSHKSLSRKITKSIYVGLYETLKEAVKAREEFIKSLF